MQVFGCQLHKPTAKELAVAALTSVLLGAALLALGLAKFNPQEAGYLVAAIYGSFASTIGLQVTKGPRYLIAHLAGGILILLAYNAVT